MVAMAKSNSTSLTARLARYRSWIQAGFLLIWLDPLLLRMHNVCGPVFHCYSCPFATFACPIGVLANFSALHVFPFVAIGTLVVFATGVGTFLCAWACPFGFLQDLVGKIPTPKFRLPPWTRFIRYAVLVVLVGLIPYWLGTEHPLFFCSLCPAGALESAIPNAVGTAMAGEQVVWPNAYKLAILGVLVVLMLFTWRPWCKLLCPLGAIYGLFNRASLLFLRYNPANCKACDMCSSLCKYGVLPDPGLNVAGCIRCLDCTRCRAISLSSVFGSSDRTRVGTRTGQPSSQAE
jgi:ferredoxin-type protein NapH